MLDHCPTCHTDFDPQIGGCPACGATAEDAAWAALWLREYNLHSADPATHAAHQIDVAQRIVQSPEAFTAQRIAWARAVLGS